MKKGFCLALLSVLLSGSVIPVNASETDISQEQLYELYRNLISNVESQYGKAQRYDVDEYASMLDGVCFAKLIDFNKDGLEDIVIVYETNEEGYRLGNYKFEIWYYNGESLAMADSGELYGTDGGTKSLCMTEYEGNTYIISGMGDDFDYEYYHGYNEKGFGIVREASYDWQSDCDEMIYSINGNNVSEDQWTSEQNAWNKNKSCFLMNQKASEEAVQIYLETKKQLGFDTSKESTVISSDEYILPNSSIDYISLDQLVALNLSAEQLRIARNEIFARHGRLFNDPGLQQYFESKSWYIPQYNAEEFDGRMNEILNDIELANIDIIKKVEKEDYIQEEENAGLNYSPYEGIEGNWYSNNGRQLLHIAISGEPDEYADGYWIDMDFDDKERYNLLLDIEGGLIYAKPISDELDDFTLAYSNGRLMKNDLALNKVPDEYTNRMIGTWYDKKHNITFEYDRINKYKSRDDHGDDWGYFYPLNDNYAIVSINLDIFHIVPYDYSVYSMTIDDDFCFERKTEIVSVN